MGRTLTINQILEVLIVRYLLSEEAKLFETLETLEWQGPAREISKADYRQCLYSFYHPLVMALKPKICSDANRLQIVIRLEPGVCVTLARFPRQNHSAKKWKNIEFAGEKPFNWIKSERDENLRRANSRESNQNRSIFLFELSVIMRYTNIKNRLEHYPSIYIE